MKTKFANPRKMVDPDLGSRRSRLIKLTLFTVILSFSVAPGSLVSAEEATGQQQPNSPERSPEDLTVAETVSEVTAFERDLGILQRKLSAASSSVLTPAGLPDELRAFLDSPPTEIEKVAEYSRLLTSILNDLSPGNPYREGSSKTRDINRAEGGLRKLSEFPEDEWISRNILNHIQAVRGGNKSDATRVSEIDRELKGLQRELRHKEWNFENEFSANKLTGESLGRGGQVFTAAEIVTIKDRYRSLQQERFLLKTVRSPVRRRVQFQIFILELTAQQRYIHALIACGFYRYLSNDTTFDPGRLEQERKQIEQESYQDDQKFREVLEMKSISAIEGPVPAIPNLSSSAPGIGAPIANGGFNAPAPPGGGEALPNFTSITGLETFLATRITDSRRKRKSLDGMIAGKRYASAQALLIDFHATARHQPELHTLPFEVRQDILNVGTNMRHLSEALTSLDYEAIRKLADEIEGSDSTVNMTDVRAFAEKYPIKARVWARQAEVLSRSGKFPDAEKMINAALEVAPLDSTVQDTIRKVQEDLLENQETLGELRNIVKDGDYREAYDRVDEFLPLAQVEGDPNLKEDFDALLDREKEVQASLEKSNALENRGEYASAWLEIVEVEDGVSDDKRFVSRRGELASRTAEFVKGYYSAKDYEASGKDAIALSWYLNLLEEVPGSDLISQRVEDLSKRLNEK
jgi:tetratricopeptide (TPR) repeat protein